MSLVSLSFYLPASFFCILPIIPDFYLSPTSLSCLLSVSLSLSLLPVSPVSYQSFLPPVCLFSLLPVSPVSYQPFLSAYHSWLLLVSPVSYLSFLPPVCLFSLLSVSPVSYQSFLPPVCLSVCLSLSLSPSLSPSSPLSLSLSLPPSLPLSPACISCLLPVFPATFILFCLLPVSHLSCPSYLWHVSPVPILCYLNSLSLASLLYPLNVFFLQHIYLLLVSCISFFSLSILLCLLLQPIYIPCWFYPSFLVILNVSVWYPASLSSTVSPSDFLFLSTLVGMLSVFVLSVYFLCPEMEVTEIILAKVLRLCQRNSREFLSRLYIF